MLYRDDRHPFLLVELLDLFFAREVGKLSRGSRRDVAARRNRADQTGFRLAFQRRQRRAECGMRMDGSND